MNPVVFRIASIELHAFTAWIMGGVVLGSAVLMAYALRYGSRWMAWLDVIVGAVVIGIIGARAGHVWLNWTYFAEHTDQITDLMNGGLDWHGALIFGLYAALIVAIIRHVPYEPLLNALTLVLPVAALAGWLASGSANAVYGVEVRTLADFPSWLVVESQDIYGTLAPRINILAIGVLWSLIILIIAMSVTAFNRLSGSRLWLLLALFAIGMGIIGFFRLDYVPDWFGRRADQILDFAIALAAVGMFAITTVVLKVRQRRISTVNAGQGA